MNSSSAACSSTGSCSKSEQQYCESSCTTSHAHVQRPATTVKSDSTQALVQSTVASETIASTETVRSSNLTNLLDRLTTTHSQMSDYAASRQSAIDEWSKAEIAKILQHTQLAEEQLMKTAEDRSLALDGSYRLKLQEWVKQQDVLKANELKELENQLHAQQQEVLSQAKAKIHAVESEVNNRKMAVLKDAQMKGASDIDQLSNLVSVAKLRPHTTTTVITTNTETGTVVSAAQAGPAIATGAAESSSFASTAAVVAEHHDGRVVQQVGHGEQRFDNGQVAGKVTVQNSTTAVVDCGDRDYCGTEKCPPRSSAACNTANCAHDSASCSTWNSNNNNMHLNNNSLHKSGDMHHTQHHTGTTTAHATPLARGVALHDDLINKSQASTETLRAREKETHAGHTSEPRANVRA